MGPGVTLRITRPGVDVAERSEPAQLIPARVHPFVLPCAEVEYVLAM